MADKTKNPKESVELSEKELAEKRDEITKYYKDHIPHLQAQYEYEGLLRDIEKCRAERMQAQKFMTQMNAPTPPVPQAPQAPKAPVINPNNRQAMEDFQRAKSVDVTKNAKIEKTNKEDGKKRTLKKATKNV
jgi:hypothetical protein